MAENNSKDTEHASGLYVELEERGVEPEHSAEYPPELLKMKDTILKEVLEAINPHAIASYVGGMIGPQLNPIKRAIQPGMKRAFPTPVDDPDSVSIHAESCGPLVKEDGHSDSALPKEDSFVAVTRGTNDDMSDLFPPKSVAKAVQEQQLDIAEDRGGSSMPPAPYGRH